MIRPELLKIIELLKKRKQIGEELKKETENERYKKGN